jgi:hypothetical protein
VWRKPCEPTVDAKEGQPQETARRERYKLQATSYTRRGGDAEVEESERIQFMTVKQGTRRDLALERSARTRDYFS